VRLLLAAALLAGCAGPAGRTDARPKWVTRDSGVFKDAGGTIAFYGRGTAAEVRLPELGWNIAKERGREEILVLVTSVMAEHTRNYLSSKYIEGDLAAGMKRFIALAVSGAALADTYVAADAGRYYALYKLDISWIKRTLDETVELDAGLRAYLKANLDRSGGVAFHPHREASEKDPPSAAPVPAAPIPEPRNAALRNIDAGLLLHYQGRYEESDRELGAAEARIKELLARPAAAADDSADYIGEPAEREMVAAFRALNADLRRTDAVTGALGEVVFVHYNGPGPRKAAKAETVPWAEGLAALERAKKAGDARALKPKVEAALRSGITAESITVASAEYAASTFTIKASDIRSGGAAAKTALVKAMGPGLAPARWRLIAHAMAKYLLAKAHEENVALKYGRGAWQYLLIQETTSATKTTADADARAPTELPAEIRLARLALPPGIHDLTVTYRDAAGEPVKTETFTGVKVETGRRAYLRARTSR